MFKNKLLILTMVLCLSGFCFADAKLSLTDLNYPKNPAYRVGISEIPENQYVQVQEDKSDITKNIERITDNRDKNSADVTFADLSINKLSKEIAQELEFEEQDMVADLSLLWQGAAMQSDTINFALYKLANPDADKPNKGTVKKMLQTIASMSTLAGAGMANPLLAGTSLIGGNVLNIMSQDTKSLNYKYTKVTDADMIILIRKVEDLQQNAVNLYYDYMTAKKQLEMISQLTEQRKKRFETAQKKNAARELIVVTDAYYRTALEKQRAAQAEFFSKRAALEQFVGNETFTQFEHELALRENGEKTTNVISTEEYNQTVQNVEEYTSDLAQDDSIAYDESGLPQLRPANSETSTSTSDTKVKKDKYSTKGLIFLHNNQTEEQEETYAQTPVDSQTVEATKPEKTKKSKKKAKEEKTVEVNFSTPNPNSAMPKTQKFNGVELLPLDEIKAPNFYKNGSIFSE